MRIRIEIDPEIHETEVVIRTARLTEEVARVFDSFEVKKCVQSLI